MAWARPQELHRSQFYPGDYSGGGTVWQEARSRRARAFITFRVVVNFNCWTAFILAGGLRGRELETPGICRR